MPDDDIYLSDPIDLIPDLMEMLPLPDGYPPLVRCVREVIRRLSRRSCWWAKENLKLVWGQEPEYEATFAEILPVLARLAGIDPRKGGTGTIIHHTLSDSQRTIEVVIDSDHRFIALSCTNG